MNFAFTEEQEELRKTVRAFLDSKSSETAVREQMETESGFDPAVWSQMGEQMGLQGLSIPEEFGGSDVNDVLNLIPALSQIEGADTSKIGMFGISRGGMMSYMTTRNNPQIKAVAVVGGMSNLFTMKRNP